MKSLLHWPRTLAARLALIFLAGLVFAYSLSFCSQFYERYQSARSMMLGNLETDVSTAVALLDRLPKDEREAWLPMVQRPNYRYRLDGGEPGEPMNMAQAPMAATSIADSIGPRYALRFEDIPGSIPHFQAHLKLADGMPLTIDVTPKGVPVAQWLPWVLVVQLALLLFCTWIAVRLAIRPLTRLAQAVDHLDPDAPAPELDERGPSEVAYAARAFNALQGRIGSYLKERMQLLAAISHDLQTPITRMKLRVEQMDDSPERERLWSDLEEMQHLVREGVAYARSMDGASEAAVKVNLDAFLDSLVLDYQDSGQAVELQGNSNAVLETRPHALRRVLTNLVDNALKFGGAAQVEVERDTQGIVCVRVLDDGPGIPEEELAEVVKPFYRVESSRNRSTGGTGLGLAIALQLSQALGGTLTLSNRTSGGLCVQLELPPAR
ncbi:HAMP domain-containing histidine kinase [Pseudomonas sp. PDM23]|uniref:histidine kinase n=1 Tax=Pseudomonas denitrificans TaxID=43306 RepID=A0A9X7R8Q5_PSEDE|nr:MULTISPECIES: HAMP domain-containing sensor histidine kinase [Pseudomonadaceae]MBD9513624.1 HAMP domain-containing histidine kinase [Pseudomonas sp. PDM22]MBD9574380.1 HAMP domain-containing histidine kinase [Pseudomonas sp. PDM23]MBD9632273.1 HAMP domain-containing histidine kinase [Pseudomonas sp. PDM19]MBD9673242.1 HAMP domain-containing histidine kinase [Pseudomonas sp. PDM21]MBD9682885.1 HAMP domain-containing histidine kinase [Pseudomonas sp. PDM20]